MQRVPILPGKETGSMDYEFEHWRPHHCGTSRGILDLCRICGQRRENGEIPGGHGHQDSGIVGLGGLGC
jgi:hypothetical protein